MACGDARQRIALPDGTELDVGDVADGESLRRVGAEVVGYDSGDGLRWLGAWSGAAAYVAGDAVSSGGSSYVCVLAHANHAPPNATYWALLASKGDAGDDGADGADGDDGAPGADGADGSDIVVSKGAADVAVGPSSAAETDLVSYSTTLAAGDRLRGRAWGVVTNNSGSNQTVTFRLKFGSTEVIRLVTPNLTSGGSRHWEVTWDLAAPSTSAQRCRLGIWTSQADAALGTGGTVLGSSDKRAHGTAAEDSTSSKALKITAQLSASDANLSLTLRAYELELV
ncbi:MAG: hypothetical protein IT460_15190 [Planctomycetes bacterium]|nr:hypothetical protein [Planctomycetota bacterium]